MDETTKRAYTVQGMSCEHCRESVIEEISGIEGVASVEVDLESGRVDVEAKEVGDDEIRSAVADAGYEVVGTHS